MRVLPVGDDPNDQNLHQKGAPFLMPFYNALHSLETTEWNFCAPHPRVSPGSPISKDMQIVIRRTYMCRRARKWVINE